MGWLRNWASNAPQVKWWTRGRPLRLATDCSGLGVPEIAADMLAGSERSVHHVFACDVCNASRQWLAGMGVSLILGDMNLRLWDSNIGVMKTRDCQGTSVAISREQADLDIYVCGFMCCITPFTPNCERAGWKDENAMTFWSSLQTIITLMPRVFVLENVKAIRNSSNSNVVDKAMGKLENSYHVITLRMNSTDYDVPQHRPRVYIVGFRLDCLPAQLQRCKSTVMKLVEARLAKAACQTFPKHFPAWLSELGQGIVPSKQCEQSEQSKQSKQSVQSMQSEQSGVCLCGEDTVCPVHACGCPKCKKNGVAKKTCLWRRTMKGFRKSAQAITQRREYLKRWRKVRQDSKLKSVPTYFELAQARGVSTDHIRQPGRRCMLIIASQHQNIMTPNAIMNYGKTFGRHQFRKDGLVPTLGHGCTTFFLPASASCLTIPQLLCLSGFHPSINKKVFQLFKDFTPADMGVLIGNSMCVPLVGHVMSIALGIISPPSCARCPVQ